MISSPMRFVAVLFLLLATGLVSAETNGVAEAGTNAQAFVYSPNAPQPVTGAVPPPVPEVSYSVLRVFGALALVIGIFLAGVWAFRNWQRLLLRGGKAPRLNVLEVRPLGGRHALYLVGCDEQRLLLAASPTGVRLLTHLPDGDPEQDDELDSPEEFAKSLERAVTPKT